jgi:hypothetical protein
MDEYRDKEKIDPKVRKAQALIKAFMIIFDGFYPNEILNDKALAEKMYLRLKIMDHVNSIAKLM